MDSNENMQSCYPKHTFYMLPFKEEISSVQATIIMSSSLEFMQNFGEFIDTNAIKFNIKQKGASVFSHQYNFIEECI